MKENVKEIIYIAIAIFYLLALILPNSTSWWIKG